jgi:hypothetical protein
LIEKTIHSATTITSRPTWLDIFALRKRSGGRWLETGWFIAVSAYARGTINLSTTRR